jgi:hypothetical protein
MEGASPVVAETELEVAMETPPDSPRAPSGACPRRRAWPTAQHDPGSCRDAQAEVLRT